MKTMTAVIGTRQRNKLFDVEMLKKGDDIIWKLKLIKFLLS